MTFDTLGLADTLVRAVLDKGYTIPTPIQAQAIPAILKGNDLMAAAQTGTGKTAGFTLPILDRLSKGTPARSNRVRALILTPTRELAAQVHENVVGYGRHLNLRSTTVFGGVKISPQMMKLRRGVDVLVATPGRLLDLYNQNALQFTDIEVLVLDEADRMLDMGFIHDIKKILALLPKNRQNLLFSATFSDEIRQLARGLLNDPVEINVAPKNTAATGVEQTLYVVDKSRKTALLSHLVRERQWHQALVFSRTKHGADRLAKQLIKDNISAAAIHGNKSQNQRTQALAGFKQGKVRILVATDIAARGIDIDQLPQVVNFDLPNVPEDYVHRIGRTGRAGMSGHAVSLVSADEVKQLLDIERLLNRKLDREQIDGFEPDHMVPQVAPRQERNKAGAGKPKPARNRNRKPANSGNSAGKPTGNGHGAGKRSPQTSGSDKPVRRQKRGNNAQQKIAV